ncbi:MAG: type II toxin-antitoxin system Phd/YefM family antitoxin [Phascolarctobacterium sp.]|nr:type II toxin-antitoxin system Phd/YefM family antitoxin [Phascolarctobacterium sp.]
MLDIRPSADLRNNYNEISNICHETHEPIYITKNGKGDLVIMSIEAYEGICNKFALYELLNEGLANERKGDVRDFNEAMQDIKQVLEHV